MSEPLPTQQYSTSLKTQIQVCYVDDSPDVRQWLMDLRRDLLRKVKQIDELLLTIPVDNK